MTGSAVSFADALRFWSKLGFVSFGGPAGQIAIMHHELVEKRRWISERRFLHAFNYCMILPGPEAQQLATYVWWPHATAAQPLSGGFDLTSALLTIAASVAVFRYKAEVIPVIAVCGLAGVVARLVFGG
jgi:chromate transporter